MSPDDTFHLQGRSSDDSGDEGEPLTRTKLDVQRHDETTALDAGATMLHGPPRAHFRERKARPRRGRRAVSIGVGAVVFLASLAGAAAITYGRGAEGAVMDECVYDAAATVLVPGGGWRSQPCVMPSPSGETYRVLLRIEDTADKGECAERFPSWDGERDKAIAITSHTREVLLCSTPAT